MIVRTPLFLCLLWIPGVLCAQELSLGKSRVSSGGGRMTGGEFALMGTIAQPEAGPVSGGGGYRLEGGFWSAYGVIQTPGTPVISILRNLNGVEIRWPVDGAANYALEESPVLGFGQNWIAIATPPVVLDGQYVLTIAFRPGHHFYRLRRTSSP